MTGMAAMFRGVNLGSRRRVSMEALRAMFETLGLRSARTYVQSGNVVFRSEARDLARLAARIEREFDRAFGFHSDVFLRTAAELRDVMGRNPFAGRPGIEPAKLLVSFLAGEPGAEQRDRFGRIPVGPEEVRLDGRELYIYYPNGMGRSKLPVAQMEKALGVTATGRNWNTVAKLAEMAGEMER